MVSPEVAESAPPARRNPLAVVALVVAIVAVLLGAALGLGTTAAQVAHTDIQAIAVLATIRTVVSTLAGAVALVLGLVALLLPRRTGRPTAAAAVAIGAVLVFGGLLALLTSLILSI